MESCQHVWIKKLDLSKVSFGKGKRMIVKGGQSQTGWSAKKEGAACKIWGNGTRGLSSLRQLAGKIHGDLDMTISKAIQEKRDVILALAARHGAHNVRVFGSVSRDEAGPQSDIDILVDLEPDRSLLDLGGLLMDLEELLGRKVDVVTEKGLHWYIRDKVLKEAVRL